MQGNICKIADFSTEIFQTRSQQNDIFKFTKQDKQLWTEHILSEKKNCLKNKGEIETFSGKQKLRDSLPLDLP